MCIRVENTHLYAGDEGDWICNSVYQIRISFPVTKATVYIRVENTHLYAGREGILSILIYFNFIA